MSKYNIKQDIEVLKKLLDNKFQPSKEEIRREGRIMDSIFASSEYRELKLAIKENKINDAFAIIEEVPKDKRSYYEGCMKFQIDHFDELNDYPLSPSIKELYYKRLTDNMI